MLTVYNESKAVHLCVSVC